MGSMYGAVIFLGVNNCATVQPIVDTERTVFYHEKAAGMYSALPYALAQVIVEIPYIFVQTLMYGIITYAMIQFEWTLAKFFWYIFIMFFTFLYFTYYGMMTVAITPNHQMASIMASAFYSWFNLVSGFLIPRPKIPKWWQWYFWICSVAYTVYGLITSLCILKLKFPVLKFPSHDLQLTHLRSLLAAHNIGICILLSGIAPAKSESAFWSHICQATVQVGKLRFLNARLARDWL